MITKSSLWNELTNNAQIWDKYKELNQVSVYDDNELQQRQLQQLKMLERKKSSEYQQINKFIFAATQKKSNLDTTFMQTIEDRVAGKIVELLNLGLWGNELNPTKRLAQGLIDAKTRDREVQEAYEELRNLLKNIEASEGVSAQILDTFKHRIQKQSGSNEKYTQDKAYLAELLAADILSKNPGWKTINTGQFVDGLGQQLIEDIMTFDKTTIGKQFKQGSLTFTVTSKSTGKKTNLQAKSVEDFLNQIEKLNGEYSINLGTNHLYEALQEASILSTQVKSGRNNQLILNTAKRNQTSLARNGVHFFDGETEHNKLLKTLHDDKSVQDFLTGYSESLASLANYSLSKRIAKASLAIAKNQLYFTERGFVTASEWLSNNKSLIKFVDQKMSLSYNTFLSTPRRYQIYKI